MRSVIQIGMLAATLALAIGCQTPGNHPPPRPLVFATDRPAEPQIEKPWIQEFSASGQIGVVVDLPRGCGYGERTSTITVHDTSTKKQIASWTRTMRETQNFIFPLANPGPGTYSIALTYEDSNSPRTTEVFTVK